METMYYIALDVHKKDQLLREGLRRQDLHRRIDSRHTHRSGPVMKTPPQPRSAAIEATMFNRLVYDHREPHAVEQNVAHPLMRAIAAWKRKNDRIDADRIWNYLRRDFLPDEERR